jgi:hypothetical protein
VGNLLNSLSITCLICTDHTKNEEILEGLKEKPVEEKLRRYKSN